MEIKDFSQELERPLKYVKGVGDSLSQLFAKKEIRNLRDALHFFPRSYEDRRKISLISELELGETATVLGRIVRSNPVFYSHSKRRAFEIFLEDDSQKKLQLTWFQGPFQKEKLVSGAFVVVRGEVKIFRGQMQIVHPELEILGKNFDASQIPKGIMPVYSETSGLYQKTIRRIVRTVVNQYGDYLLETLPASILQKYGFPSYRDAIRTIHMPTETADFDQLQTGTTKAHQRLIYEEFFELALGLARKRSEFSSDAGIAFSKPKLFWDQLKENLPFQFTGAQRRVLQEVLDDMTTDRRMHRLVQGDVGSGKTVVAAAAALIALEAGYQVCLMAPTEILVEQHYRNFEFWFRGLGIEFSKLVGSLSTPERRKNLEKLKCQSPLMVFGTHALFEPVVQFQNLGLVIVDEQHRFGVRQRAALLGKGAAPDLLVMTATPIPRTLALTLYGDLELSVIDELPPGRKPIVTQIFTDKNRFAMEEKVRKELQAGRQVYVIYPLIEESEKLKLKSVESMIASVKASYVGFSVETLHGRMSAEEKNEKLQAFKRGEISVLVSTTVVEVGVDNPQATVMIIENAERFGLSQLHQLRGRIGRGSHESFCFLMASHLGTPEILQRLKVMEHTQDGFKIAERDLEMRGSGEFLGTRQSGLPQFQVAKLPGDLEWFYKARQDAFDLIKVDPKLQTIPLIRDRLEQKIKTVGLN